MRTLCDHQSYSQGPHKANGPISKRVFQKTKHAEFCEKTNVSYHLTRTRACVYQGIRNVRFSENLACFVFLKHLFWDSHFWLITDKLNESYTIKKSPTGNFFNFWLEYIFDVNVAVKKLRTHINCPDFRIPLFK